MIENVPLRIEHGIDGMRRYAHASISEHAIGRSEVEQVNAERAQHHRVVGRALVTADAHLLGCVQRRLDARLIEHLDARHVERVLQSGADGEQAVIAQVIVVRRVRRQAAAHGEARRHVQHRHAGTEALAEGRGVHKRFESLPWLAVALRSHIELSILRIVGIGIAQQDANVAVMEVDQHFGGIGEMICWDNAATFS